MSIEKWLAAGCVAVAMSMGSALAAEGECTDEMLEAKQGELFAYLQANPEKGEKFESAVAEVEEEYGGEPPREKQCEAMDKLMAAVKAL